MTVCLLMIPIDLLLGIKDELVRPSTLREVVSSTLLVIT